MDRKNIVVMDVETGGLDCTRCAVTQIAMVVISNVDFTIIDEYAAYIKPYDMDYDDGAMTYTKTTKAALESKGQDVDTVAKEIVATLEKANTAAKYKNRHQPILAGHNVLFDVGFVQTLLIGCGHEDKLKKLYHGNTDGWGNYQPNTLDTWDLAISKYGDTDKKKFNLETVCDYENVEIIDAHNALPDTRATAQILINFLSSLRSGGGASLEAGELIKARSTFQI